MGTGTLTITGPNFASSTARKPAYISTSTTHASLWINGGPINRIACTTTCTFTWSAPAGSDDFQAEIDDGTNVLAAGGHTYTIVAGANGDLGKLTVNGVANTLTFTDNSPFTGTPDVLTGKGTFAIGDWDSHPITTPGTFDNRSITLSTVKDSGTYTGVLTIACPGGGTCSGLEVEDPSALGNDYTFTVTCGVSDTATFHLTATTGNSPVNANLSLEPTGGEYAGVPVTYTSGFKTITGFEYTCTNGTLTDATGTITLQ